jgi:hypothetical protein
MTAVHPTAQQAFDQMLKTTSGHPVGKSTAFLCPFANCKTFALQNWGSVHSLTVHLGPNTATTRILTPGTPVDASLCPACGQEAIYVNQRLVHPKQLDAPDAHPDMPQQLQGDYEEARVIFHDSPRGAAALLRLVVQKLCPLLGAKAGDINNAIGELVQRGIIPAVVQQALDTVRVVGNEAVHPGELDLRDDEPTVLALFKLINFIVEKAITEPQEVKALFASLPPAKLAGIQNRDARAAPQPEPEEEATNGEETRPAEVPPGAEGQQMAP